jgi:gluconate 2-dehydrogenase gamma chain
LPKTRYPRRRFLKTVGVVAGGTSVLSGCRNAPKAWRFLTDEEAKTVMAIGEQIIPADQDPGATQAGCTNFIDKQLVGPYKRYQSAYRAGIAGVHQTAAAMFGGRFESLEWDKQTAVLKALESGKAPGVTWQNRSSPEFFEMIRDHVMQGFYGSPRHGGNRDYVSYRMIGIDFPQIIGQNRYRKS